MFFASGEARGSGIGLVWLDNVVFRGSFCVAITGIVGRVDNLGKLVPRFAFGRKDRLGDIKGF